MAIAACAAQLGAKVLFGDAAFIDEHSIQLNGNAISAKNWLIATGPSAAVPPMSGMHKTPHWTIGANEG